MEASIREQFEQLMQREAGSVQELVATLKQEHEALKQGDADNLDKVIALKEQQLTTLNTLAAERADLLKQVGFSDDKSGFADALDADSSGTLASLWQQISDDLLTCQQQNEVNGKLLDVNKQQAQELLSVLLGKEAGGTALYDQSGNTAAANYNRNTSIKV